MMHYSNNETPKSNLEIETQSVSMSFVTFGEISKLDKLRP